MLSEISIQREMLLKNRYRRGRMVLMAITVVALICAPFILMDFDFIFYFALYYPIHALVIDSGFLHFFHVLSLAGWVVASIFAKKFPSWLFGAAICYALDTLLLAYVLAFINFDTFEDVKQEFTVIFIVHIIFLVIMGFAVAASRELDRARKTEIELE